MKPLIGSRTLPLLTALFVAAAAVLAGLAFAGSELLRDRAVTVPLVLVLLGAGALALLGWSQARHAASALAAEHERALAAERERLEGEVGARAAALEAERERIDAAARDRVGAAEADRQQRTAELADALRRLDEREAVLRSAHDDLEEERRARARAEQSRREEKEWALHLRREVMQLQAARGTIGDTSDVRELVLQTAIKLVEAEKGLLLSREDLDADGDLDLICHHGFEHDPTHSAVAQRFAGDVIERDETVREGEIEIAPERRTPADAEIQNLLAIPIYMVDKFSGVVVLANKPGGFHDYDDEVLLALGDHAGAVLHNQRLQDELRTSYVGTVRVLADAIEAKDRFLRGHAEEVSDCVAAVADRVGLEPERREELVYSSLLHDVGKIGISERILMKPAELTPEERSIVQLHPRIGYRLIQQVPALRATELAILHHHERWDGDGYPAGLRGDEIPIEARIVAAADAFSAMTADRPYKARMSLEEACAELERCAGTQFDPAVVELFVDEVRRRPSTRQERDPLHEALADPAIEARRDDGDPILGAASFATTDNLTLLYSHRYLHEAAEAETRRASAPDRVFSVVMIELADIARINREQGYRAGDEAIRVAA
jgi:HD-GYP domain-containing protein (c-di-GMP phosphodiesterase class II)